jgi:hypothetical protein
MEPRRLAGLFIMCGAESQIGIFDCPIWNKVMFRNLTKDGAVSGGKLSKETGSCA